MPLITDAMAQQFWDGYEAYFDQLSDEELLSDRPSRVAAGKAGLSAALSVMDHIPSGLPGTWLYAVDDALETMEMAGMHAEHSYKTLKEMHRRAEEDAKATTPTPKPPMVRNGR